MHFSIAPMAKYPHGDTFQRLSACRKHGMSDASFYKWKARYGGLEVFRGQALKSLEDENTRQKRLLAEAMLDNAALKELLGKNGDARRTPRGRRAFAHSL